MLAVLVVARFAPALALDLGRDEAAYWYWAWHGLDASFSLVTGLAVRVSTALLGDSPPAVRLPAAMAGAAQVVLAWRVCRRAGAGREAAWLGAAVIATVPTLAYSGAFLHTDAFLVLFTLLFAERAAAVRAEGPGGGRLTGVAAAAALAVLSKLTGALLLVPAAWIVVRHRRAGATVLAAAAMLAAAAAMLMGSMDPRVLAGVREFGRFAPGLAVAERAGWIATELIAWCGPALLLAAAAGAAAMRSGPRRAAWPAWAAAALLLAFFAAFAALGQAKANWFVPGFVLLVPPGVVALERAGREAWLRRAAAVSAAIVLLQAAALLLPGTKAWDRVVASALAQRVDASYAAHVGPREGRVSPTRRWSERAAEYRPAVRDDPRLAGAKLLAARDYGLAFRAAHALGREVEVWLPWDPVFAVSCSEGPAPGGDVLFVSSGDAPPAPWAARFTEVQELHPAGRSLRVWSCRGWRGKEGETK